MKNLDKIIGIIHDIKHFDAEIRAMNTWDDEVGQFMRQQFQDIRLNLVKDLTVELISWGMPLHQVGAFLSKISPNFSVQKEQVEPLPQILKSGLQEVARLGTAA